MCLTHSWCEIKKFVTFICVLHTSGVRLRSLLLWCVSYTLVVWDQEKNVKFVTLMCVLHTRGVRSRSLLLWCVSYTLVVWAQEENEKSVTLMGDLHARGVSSRKECEVCYFVMSRTHVVSSGKECEICYCFLHSWCELKKTMWSLLLCCISHILPVWALEGNVKLVTLMRVLHTHGVSSRKECGVCYFALCLTLVVWAQEKSVKCITLLYVSHSWCELKKRVWSVLLFRLSHTRCVSSRKECELCYFVVCLILVVWAQEKSVKCVCRLSHTRCVSSRKECEVCYFIVCLTLVLWAQEKSVKCVTLLYASRSWCGLKTTVWSFVTLLCVLHSQYDRACVLRRILLKKYGRPAGWVHQRFCPVIQIMPHNRTGSKPFLSYC